VDTIEIIPVRKVEGTIEVPGSKSYTARALIAASLAEGDSILRNPLFSDDTDFMISGLKKLGIDIHGEDNFLKVAGSGGHLSVPSGEIFLGNAGTAVRFLTGLSALCPGRVIITGDGRMQKRPILELLRGLNRLNIKTSSPTGCPPVEVYGGTFEGGRCEMNGGISSQYFTSILMISPFAKKDVIIKVIGELTSKSYIDITLDIMQKFGVTAENNCYREFFLKAGQRYKGREYLIECDASSASYFFAAAAITGGRIVVKGINPYSLQGDGAFIDILEKMGCSVLRSEEEVELTGYKLRGVEVDMNNMPDTVQTLSVVACFAKGRTVIKNVSNLRIKETDRLKALVCELEKIGVAVEEERDGIIIEPVELYRGGEIETYNDHRVAMSFSLMGLRVPGIRIKNPSCVSKSFPGFWSKLEELGIKLKRRID